MLVFGQGFDLRGSAMDDDNPNIKRAEHCDIQEYVWEILVGDDRAINADDKGPLAKARDILQDAPQVSRFHNCYSYRI